MRKRLGFKDRKNEKKEGKYIQVQVNAEMNSKMVRVHINKKAFISRRFSWSLNFGLYELELSIIWSLIG